MNYDLCSGTCLKKSGIYSVAMFQKIKSATPKGMALFIFWCNEGDSKRAPASHARKALKPGAIVRWIVASARVESLPMVSPSMG